MFQELQNNVSQIFQIDVFLTCRARWSCRSRRVGSWWYIRRVWWCWGVDIRGARLLAWGPITNSWISLSLQKGGGGLDLAHLFTQCLHRMSISIRWTRGRLIFTLLWARVWASRALYSSTKSSRAATRTWTSATRWFADTYKEGVIYRKTANTVVITSTSFTWPACNCKADICCW